MKQIEKDARKFLTDWFGLYDEEHFGDNDTEIAEYIYEDVKNGDIDEIISIMKKFAKDYHKKQMEND